MLIYRVAVDPGRRHRGHVTFLMRVAEKDAAKPGISRIRLYTNVLIKENIEIYRKLGYRKVGREPYEGSILVHMARVLGP